MFELIVIISTLFFLILVYFLYTILKLHDKKSKEYLIELDKIKLEHEKNLLSTQIEIQEQTLLNISREIHDNILQKLTLAKLYLYPKETETINSKNADCLDIVTEVINDLGDISRSLNSDLILSNGLINALETEIALLQRLDKHIINFTVNGEYVFLNNKKELILFRIIQESLNNVLKHANSKMIDIILDFRKDDLSLVVKDYGKGYDINQSKNGKSSGISNMIERTHMIGGEFNIDSIINEGTTIKVEMPYENG
jgi:signal transduction histidine kinase